VHWWPDEWARHQAAEDEARRRQRAGERQSAASACLVFVGLLLATAVTGSAAPAALLAVLVAVGVALIVRDGLGSRFRGR
jgi:Flp pilus assembly protein TadB